LKAKTQSLKSWFENGYGPKAIVINYIIKSCLASLTLFSLVVRRLSSFTAASGTGMIADISSGLRLISNSGNRKLEVL
jgi:hypothetical protein